MPLRVLVVDDEPALCKALMRELRGEFEVSVAHDTADALATWDATGPFDAVVSDFSMGSGPDGLALLGEIKLRRPDAARILVSAACDPRSAQEALNADVVHRFLPKPWSPGEVAATVRRIVHVLQLPERSRSGSLEVPQRLDTPRPARRSVR